MPTTLPSKLRRRLRPVPEVVWGVIEQKGREIFSELIQNKMGEAAPPEFAAFLTRLRKSYADAETVRERAQLLLWLGLLPSSFLGGIGLGAQLPDLDLRLRRRGSAKDAITVHSAPRFAADLGLDWVNQILEISKLSPDLPRADRQLLGALADLSRQVKSGVAVGFGWRRDLARHFGLRWLKPPERALRLDAPTYQMAEALFASLSAPRRKDR